MNRLFDILKRYDYVVVFVLLLSVSVVMIVQTNNYQRSRVTRWGNAVSGRWYAGVQSVSGYFGLKGENERLAAENARLRARLEESYISYTDSVFTVNDTVYRQRYDYMEAAVIKNSWTGQNNYLMIGKGRDNGVEEDMAVISPTGIVALWWRRRSILPR